MGRSLTQETKGIRDLLLLCCVVLLVELLPGTRMNSFFFFSPFLQKADSRFQAFGDGRINRREGMEMEGKGSEQIHGHHCKGGGWRFFS